MNTGLVKYAYEPLIAPKTAPNVKQVLRLTAFFLCFYALLALYFRNKCYADPTSYFFQPSIAYSAPHSTNRIQQADSYADSFTSGSRLYRPDSRHATDSSSVSAPTTLCIGIPSVRRPRLSYLKTTLASLHDGLDENAREHVFFSVLLAHTNQSEHPDFGAPWLHGMTDQLVTYGPKNSTKYEVATLMEQDGVHEVKSKFDYALVLEECLKTRSDYVMMIEDDLVFTSTWWEQTMRALQEARDRTQKMGYDDFFYLRLFYYEGIRGWTSESWPTYLAISTGIAATVFAFLLLIQRLQSPSHSFGFSRCTLSWLHRRLHMRYVLLITFVFTPAIIGLYFSAGANCMLPEPRGVSLMTEYACCGQALVFRRAVALDHVLPLFREREGGSTPVDSLIEEYANNMTSWDLKRSKRIGDMRWAVTPVLLQHVGSQSSHGVDREGDYGVMTPVKLWNFGFERAGAGHVGASM